MYPVQHKLTLLGFFFPPRDELFGTIYRASVCLYPTLSSMLLLEQRFSNFHLPLKISWISGYNTDSQLPGPEFLILKSEFGFLSGFQMRLPAATPGPHFKKHYTRVIVLKQIGAFVHWVKPFHVYRIKQGPTTEQGTQACQLFQLFPPLCVWFRHTKHFPVLPSHYVLSHFQFLHRQFSPRVFFSYFYIWVDSHSLVKVLLKNVTFSIKPSQNPSEIEFLSPLLCPLT